MAKITKDTTIGEVLMIDRGTAAVFMQFGMHCIGCPASSNETIEQAAAVHGVDADEILKALDAYLKGEEN